MEFIYRQFILRSTEKKIDLIVSDSYDTSNIDYFWKNDKELAVMKKEMPEYELLSFHKEKSSRAYPSGKKI